MSKEKFVEIVKDQVGYHGSELSDKFVEVLNLDPDGEYASQREEEYISKSTAFFRAAEIQPCWDLINLWFWFRRAELPEKVEEEAIKDREKAEKEKKEQEQKLEAERKKAEKDQKDGKQGEEQKQKETKPPKEIVIPPLPAEPVTLFHEIGVTPQDVASVGNMLLKLLKNPNYGLSFYSVDGYPATLDKDGLSFSFERKSKKNLKVKPGSLIFACFEGEKIANDKNRGSAVKSGNPLDYTRVGVLTKAAGTQWTVAWTNHPGPFESSPSYKTYTEYQRNGQTGYSADIDSTMALKHPILVFAPEDERYHYGKIAASPCFRIHFNKFNADWGYSAKREQEDYPWCACFAKWCIMSAVYKVLLGLEQKKEENYIYLANSVAPKRKFSRDVRVSALRYEQYARYVAEKVLGGLPLSLSTSGIAKQTLRLTEYSYHANQVNLNYRLMDESLDGTQTRLDALIYSCSPKAEITETIIKEKKGEKKEEKKVHTVWNAKNAREKFQNYMADFDCKPVRMEGFRADPKRRQLAPGDIILCGAAKSEEKIESPDGTLAYAKRWNYEHTTLLHSIEYAKAKQSDCELIHFYTMEGNSSDDTIFNLRYLENPAYVPPAPKQTDAPPDAAAGADTPPNAAAGTDGQPAPQPEAKPEPEKPKEERKDGIMTGIHLNIAEAITSAKEMIGAYPNLQGKPLAESPEELETRIREEILRIAESQILIETAPESEAEDAAQKKKQRLKAGTHGIASLPKGSNSNRYNASVPDVGRNVRSMHAWDAAFIYWCLKQAGDQDRYMLHSDETYSQVPGKRFPAVTAEQFEALAKEQGLTPQGKDEGEAGDLVIRQFSVEKGSKKHPVTVVVKYMGVITERDDEGYVIAFGDYPQDKNKQFGYVRSDHYGCDEVEAIYDIYSRNPDGTKASGEASGQKRSEDGQALGETEKRIIPTKLLSSLRLPDEINSDQQLKKAVAKAVGGEYVNLDPHTFSFQTLLYLLEEGMKHG